MEVKIFNKVLVAKNDFWSRPVESIHSGLDDEINEWISKNPNIKINNIKQSQSGGSFGPSVIVISIWYE